MVPALPEQESLLQRSKAAAKLDELLHRRDAMIAEKTGNVRAIDRFLNIALLRIDKVKLETPHGRVAEMMCSH